MVPQRTSPVLVHSRVPVPVEQLMNPALVHSRVLALVQQLMSQVLVYSRVLVPVEQLMSQVLVHLRILVLVVQLTRQIVHSRMLVLVEHSNLSMMMHNWKLLAEFGSSQLDLLGVWYRYYFAHLAPWDTAKKLRSLSRIELRCSRQRSHLTELLLGHIETAS